MYLRILVLIALAAAPVGPVRAETPPIKIGTLAFGTLNWELAVIRDENLAEAEHLAIDTVPLASAEAGKIALQGNSVDMVVGDWIWVAKQREQGLDFTFAPYSTSAGALMVPQGSPIRAVADLKGKRLGIAGGGLDKNWLLLRALAQKTQGLDLDREVVKTFGAPPLLNQQLQQGNLDAVLNYWNHAAKLEAQGYRKVLDGRGLLRGLGIEDDVPALGYVFRESYAKTHGAALAGFFRAAERAKQRICEADATWSKLAPVIQEPDAEVRSALRRQYCEGRVTGAGGAHLAAAASIYALIQAQSGAAGGPLPAGVFWAAPR